MTQEDRKLLLKDLCARLPYNVIINCKGRGTEYKCFLTSDILDEILYKQEYYNYKPYLRPMSSMTEEEEIEFVAIGSIVSTYGAHNYFCILSFDESDWLNAHHFDYRDLIEKGLALEAPEGMYKID